ncbi:hypothetical protein Acr_18g0002220 [Actinidia rufa]|uniref:NB-ARC domain-containing disease resistance protein n=1 Tax=Actinidia rufa TaxID=165716 RepID=A0A7J0G5P8_9ERIC|nr:hypothetical protein Acr_18g0002220 [Actinidia rufa]
MAQAAVSFLLGKIDNLVGREWKLLTSIDGRVDNLRRELKTIEALLTDVADARGEEDAQSIEWIQQVRDLAYAIDNVLDTFILHLAKHPPRVLDLTRWFTHFDARHLIANQIQEINTMMDSIKPTKEKCNAMLTPSVPQASSSSKSGTGNDTFFTPRIAGLYAEEADIVGIEEPKRKLISWALDQRHPTCKVMFVVGMGGSGKTALVKKVFDSIKAEFDCHARITVSRSKEMPELLWDIFNQLSRPTAEPTPLSSSQFNKVYLLDKLSSHLQGKRDSSSIDVHKIQPLPQEKAQELFYKKAFPPNGTCPKGLVDRSKSILEKCEGLPLGIIEIGFEISKKINRLRDLQKLSFVKAKKHLISSLGHLTQLRELGITDLSEADGPILCKSIQALQNLQSLNVTSLHKEEYLDLREIENPPPLLQRLYLKGRLRKMPDWISKLHDLVRIRLKWSRLTHDPIPRLQDLPNLLELQLLDAYTGTQLNFDAGKFQKLKILELEQLEDLEMVWLNSGSMPGLQKLTIRHCNKLKQVPRGTFENFTHLKEVRLA